MKFYMEKDDTANALVFAFSELESSNETEGFSLFDFLKNYLIYNCIHFEKNSHIFFYFTVKSMYISVETFMWNNGVIDARSITNAF